MPKDRARKADTYDHAVGHSFAGLSGPFIPGDVGYMQTNEIRNAIIHYSRSANGMITELEHIPTGGAGSGIFKPISGQDSAPEFLRGRGSAGKSLVSSSRSGGP